MRQLDNQVPVAGSDLDLPRPLLQEGNDVRLADLRVLEGKGHLPHRFELGIQVAHGKRPLRRLLSFLQNPDEALQQHAR